MPTLEETIAFAATKHAGQTDKAGKPYIFHVLRVANGVESAPWTQSDDVVIALLHDVVEDSSTTLDDLHAMGYSDAIVAAVDTLTRRTGEDYESYLKRVKMDAKARRVKVFDLLDNMNLRRLSHKPTQADKERAAKYAAALMTLGWQEGVEQLVTNQPMIELLGKGLAGQLIGWVYGV